LADRLADAAGGDRYAVVTDFVQRIAGTLAVDDVLPQVARTATTALRSSRGEVRLWFADGGEWRQTWPPDEAHVPDAVSVSLHHAGTSVGRLAVDADLAQIGQAERDLLNRLAGPAGLALSNVRLTFQLRHELEQAVEIAEQLRRSRERLLDIAAVQRLRFAVEVDARVLRPLDAADAALEDVASGDTDALVAARAAAEAALVALRELAAGIFPAALVDRGVVAALEGHLQANFPRAQLRVDPTVASHHELAVAAAVYFCAVALLSHADRDEPCLVELTMAPGGLRLELRVHAQRPPSPETAALVGDRAAAADATADLVGSTMLVSFPVAPPTTSDTTDEGVP
jgi:hypothetical protein